MRIKIAFWLIVMVLGLLVLNYGVFRGSSLVEGMRSGTNAIIYPFQYLTHFVIQGSVDRLHRLAYLGQAAKENDLLKAQLAEIQSRQQTLDALVRENQSLREALSIKSASSYAFGLLPARVISRSPDTFFMLVEIDKGSSQGVKKDQAVICSEGLVGKIVEVSRFSSQVLLLIDPASSVSVINQRTKSYGVAQGLHPGTLIIRYIPVQVEVKIADVFTTSGIGSIFPPGLKVGEVSKVDKKDNDIFQRIEVRPSVDFSGLNYLFVVL